MSRAYRRLLVSPADQMLRLLIWFKDPQDESKGFRIFKRRTADFGDPAAALALYCALVKYVAPHATLEAAKVMINSLFADNIMGSENDKEVLMAAVDELLKLCANVGLPLKKPVFALKTDPDILKKLDKEDNPTVTQLLSLIHI